MLHGAEFLLFFYWLTFLRKEIICDPSDGWNGFFFSTLISGHGRMQIFWVGEAWEGAAGIQIEETEGDRNERRNLLLYRQHFSSAVLLNTNMTSL